MHKQHNNKMFEVIALVYATRNIQGSAHVPTQNILVETSIVSSYSVYLCYFSA